MRFACLRTQASADSRAGDAAQQRGYLQRMRCQLMSLRGGGGASASDTTRPETAEQERDVASPLDTKPDAQDAAPPRDDDSDEAGDSASTQPPPRAYLTWAEARSRLQHTTLQLRAVCAAKSSLLLSVGPWLLRLRRAPSRASSASPVSLRRHSDNDDVHAELAWLRAQVLDAARAGESEISIRVSCFSARALSDSPMRERESDVVRRRCSSADSYASAWRDATPCGADWSSDDGDSDREQLRESSLFRASGESVRESWFRRSNGELVRVRSQWI